MSFSMIVVLKITQTLQLHSKNSSKVCVGFSRTEFMFNLFINWVRVTQKSRRKL
jgi:hypothetical protein